MPEMPDVVAGEPVASDWGNLIRSRTVQRYADATDRDALVPLPATGDAAWLDDVDLLTLYTGTAWVGVLNLSGGTLSGALTLGLQGIQSLRWVREDVAGSDWSWGMNSAGELLLRFNNSNRVIVTDDVWRFLAQAGLNNQGPENGTVPWTVGFLFALASGGASIGHQGSNNLDIAYGWLRESGSNNNVPTPAVAGRTTGSTISFQATRIAFGYETVFTGPAAPAIRFTINEAGPSAFLDAAVPDVAALLAGDPDLAALVTEYAEPDGEINLLTTLADLLKRVQALEGP